MPSDNALTRRLHQLEERLKRVERGQRVAHGASIENAALEVRDDGGSLRAVVGQQPDGTTAVNVTNGPVPPAPTAPAVEPALAALNVTWDGTFADGAVAPLDWMRTEVHVGPTADFTPDQSTLRDTIESPQGGTVVVSLPYTEWWIRLRSRTTSGVASTPTAAVAGTPRKADAPDIVAGAITADAIAVDALTGKTITGGTINGATVTGGILQTSSTGQRVVVTPDDGYGRPAMELYSGASIEQDPGRIAARVFGGGTQPRPYIGLYAPNVTTAITNPASMYLLSGGGGSNDQGEWEITTGNGSGGETSISAYASDGGPNIGQLTLSVWAPGTGEGSLAMETNNLYWSSAGVGSLYADDTGLIVGGKVTAQGNAEVQGVLKAESIVTGSVTITPTAANTPTPMTISGLNIKGTTLRGYATANTTVPAPSTGSGGTPNGVNSVAVSSVSSTGLTVWVNRQNTTNTVVNWMVIGS